MRIACLHTVDSNIAVFEAARSDLGLDQVELRHEVRADLLQAAERAGTLTPEITAATAEALLALSRDADAVLLTCSTVGPAVGELALSATPMPVLRVDAALASHAVAKGGRVVALCAVETTIEPTRRLFEEAARSTGAVIEVRLVPDAWAAFKAGDRERYHRLVAAAADKASEEGATSVALAQASMAGAAKLSRLAPVPLTSPAVGLAAAVGAVGKPSAKAG
ncbi:MAG: Asp/Glu racemase [Proteobacteria bacterium]|nr:Asp/Glu racemase [Pseudomonadota bacterium]